MLNTIPRKGQPKSVVGNQLRGKGPLQYAREGYHWVNGQYVPKGPEATGITLKSHGMSRRERRYWASKQGQRKLRYLQSLDDE